MRRLVMSRINSHSAITHTKKTVAAATAAGDPLGLSRNINKKNNQMMTAPAVTFSLLPAAAPPAPSQWLCQPTAVLPCTALTTPARAFHDYAASPEAEESEAVLAVLRLCERYDHSSHEDDDIIYKLPDDDENSVQDKDNGGSSNSAGCGSKESASRSEVGTSLEKSKARTTSPTKDMSPTKLYRELLKEGVSLVILSIRKALRDDWPLIADALVAADWETIAHLFNAAVADIALKMPQLRSYALPAEEIAAMARDIGHPLRRLVNQISYAEHGAVDVSGLYRQVRHAAYAPPVVVPDAEVAAFAQCLLQQTSAMEHALAASAAANTTREAEVTSNRPKKTKRARSSSHSTKEENIKDPSTTDALLDIFNQAVRASVPTCAEWAYTHAMIAEVTATARVMLAGNKRSTDLTTERSTTTNAARRVLEALVAANGRILGTITLPAPPPKTDGGEGWEQTGFVRWFTHHCSSRRDNTVYVRAVYEELWAQLSDPKRSFGWDLPGAASLSPVLLLVGSPGIGKSWALNYLLYKAVTEERAGCPKRLVMLLTTRAMNLWAFLPDGRVLKFQLMVRREPPQRIIEQLVHRSAPPPSSRTGACAPPALLLYDARAHTEDSRPWETPTVPGAIIVPNMITVMTPSLPHFLGGKRNESAALEDVRALVAHRVVETFYMPPLGEHEFKAFFKGHPDVERALDEIKKKEKNSTEKKNNTDSSEDEKGNIVSGDVPPGKEGASSGAGTSKKEDEVDALVAETFEKYGGVVRHAFNRDTQADIFIRLVSHQRPCEPQLAHHCFHRETPNEAVVMMVPTASSGVAATTAPLSRRGGDPADPLVVPNNPDQRKNCDYTLAFRSPHLAKRFAENVIRFDGYVRNVDASHCKTLDYYQQSLQTNKALKAALKEGCDGLKRACECNNTNNMEATLDTTMEAPSVVLPPPVQSVFDVSNSIATLLLEGEKRKKKRENNNTNMTKARKI